MNPWTNMDLTLFHLIPFEMPEWVWVLCVAECQLEYLQPLQSTKLFLSVFFRGGGLVNWGRFGSAMGFRGLVTVIGRIAWELWERGELRRRVPHSSCVWVKVVWLRIVLVRGDLEGVFMEGIVLGESVVGLLAVAKIEILLGVPVTRLVVLFLQWGWVECLVFWPYFQRYLSFFWD